MLIFTSIISVATLIVSIYNGRTLNKNKEKDRRIAVELSEKRRMQNDLFEHITKVLDLGRRCLEETDENEKQKMKFELLNHKPFIWINLDRKNHFQKDLRTRCNLYIMSCADFVESSKEEAKNNYKQASNQHRNRIWVLIDNYIEEENKSIEKLM
ncbi:MULTISPECIES: hypothetical protein [Bacillus]|uniref:hypothetical protein n=1 Tax=Bacillus TaxID=1386 RepID=UPI000BEC3051|nr:hypothetical protein [Bacillus cereus]PEE94064.1 hypothetical protein COM92_14315 [Bacillus cereus]PGN75416.1 hypothetical protein CN967_18850 [Bacillus cereus]